MHDSDTRESLLAAALGRRNRSRPPVWLMRQAGRYLPEYREIRKQHTFKQMCDDPQIAIEVSLLPHRLLDVDAIIVFNDILIPLEKMGAPLSYGDGGPVFSEPVRDEAALERLRPIDPDRDTGAILDTIRGANRELHGSKPVLGFAGAPFTLASYLVEGRLGQGVETLKQTLYARPQFVRDLLERLTEMTIAYLSAQVRAGAAAVQLFDTWAGHLDREAYREFVAPTHRRIFEALRSLDGSQAPAILYVRDSAHVLEDMGSSGADAVSVEWRTPLGEARRWLGDGIALQGNLDPTSLFAPADEVRRRTRALLEERRGDPSFIVNLGHGVLPGTPVDSVRALIETVHSFEP